MKRIVTAALGFALLAAGSQATLAGPQCGPRDSIIEMLGKQYKEARQALGLASGVGSVIELFVSNEGTWTMTMTDASGKTCVVAAGEGWQRDAKQVAGFDA